MIRKLTILILAGTLLLVGCETIKPVVKTEYSVIKPPASLMQECAISKPTSVVDYMALPTQDKIKSSYQYSVELMTNLEKCNAQLQSLRQFVSDQTKIIEGN